MLKVELFADLSTCRTARLPGVNPAVAGAGMSKADEFVVVDDKPPKPVLLLALKMMVAPETAAGLVADKLVKVTVPSVNTCTAALPVPKLQPELLVAT